MQRKEKESGRQRYKTSEKGRTQKQAVQNRERDTHTWTERKEEKGGK